MRKTYMEAISAIERYTKEKPTNTIRNAQITPAVPPLVMIVARVVSSTSHVAIRVHANPTIEVNWKFLWRGCVSMKEKRKESDFQTRLYVI